MPSARSAIIRGVGDVWQEFESRGHFQPNSGSLAKCRDRSHATIHAALMDRLQRGPPDARARAREANGLISPRTRPQRTPVSAAHARKRWSTLTQVILLGAEGLDVGRRDFPPEALGAPGPATPGARTARAQRSRGHTLPLLRSCRGPVSARAHTLSYKSVRRPAIIAANQHNSRRQRRQHERASERRQNVSTRAPDR